MRRTLYIHAGVHRTATTSIQGFLRANNDVLAQKGYLNFNGAGRQMGLFNQIFSGKTDVHTFADRIAKQADRKGEIHTILLSDEDIPMRGDLSVLQPFSDHFDVRILLSLRRQDLWLESWHQQNVKVQWNPALAHVTFPEFLEQRSTFDWIHYDRLVARFEALFGKENLRLRVFEERAMPKGPVAAYAEDIGLPDLMGFEAPPHANASLSPVFSEFMRVMPLEEFQPAMRQLIRQAVVRAHTQSTRRADAPVSALLMDHATRQAVMADYAEGNAKVAAAYFGGGPLFHDPLPPEDAPLADQALPADSYALMESLVSPMLRNIVKELAAAEKAKAKQA